MAVVPLTDLRNETFGGPLLLRCPAASLQDMAAFDARYKSMGYPYFTMGIKIGFDAQESFPKFTFAAIRPLTEAEAQVVVELRNSPETARVVNEGSAPAVAQIAAPAQGAFLEAPPKDAVKPQQVAVQPAAIAQPTAAQPQPAAVQPAGGTPAVTAGGFGRVATAQPATQPNAGQPAAGQPAVAPTAKPAVKMTGFGAVTPEVTAQPAQVQPDTNGAAQPAQTAPATVSAFEGSIDDRLASLLASTGGTQ